MGYIFDFNDANRCNQWFKKPHHSDIVEMEHRLLLNMLSPLRGKAVLDIGCGTGKTLEYLLYHGLEITGIEPSPYMLDIAAKNLGHRADLHRGKAESLPFDDNTFNYSSMIIVLEFVDDPWKALEEAFRVTRDRTFIGILNPYTINGMKLYIKKMFTETLYKHARFFSIWEIKKMIRELLGEVPVSWRSIHAFPPATGEIGKKIAYLNLAQRSPFGAFVGIAVTLRPRFRTRPLELKSCSKGTTEVVPG